MIYDSDDIAAAVARALARDLAQPDDAGRTPEKYARLGRDCNAGARRHLDENDLPQASRKAWEMVAETVKAICARHGGIIHLHGSIWLTVRELTQLVGASGDIETRGWINNAFSIARLLHSNSFLDEESYAEVASGIALCEQLSARLYQLFWPEGAGG